MIEWIGTPRSFSRFKPDVRSTSERGRPLSVSGGAPSNISGHLAAQFDDLFLLPLHCFVHDRVDLFYIWNPEELGAAALLSGHSWADRAVPV
jgi:hypothetical protein